MRKHHKNFPMQSGITYARLLYSICRAWRAPARPLPQNIDATPRRGRSSRIDLTCSCHVGRVRCRLLDYSLWARRAAKSLSQEARTHCLQGCGSTAYCSELLARSGFAFYDTLRSFCQRALPAAIAPRFARPARFGGLRLRWSWGSGKRTGQEARGSSPTAYRLTCIN